MSRRRRGIDGTRCHYTLFEPHGPSVLQRQRTSTSAIAVTGPNTASRTVPGAEPYGCIFDVVTMESTDPTPTQNSGHKVRRPRAARACNLCRLKKNKCDELYPCTYCRSTSILRNMVSRCKGLTGYHRSQCRVRLPRARLVQEAIHPRVCHPLHTPSGMLQEET